jgi:hypothetical protein
MAKKSRKPFTVSKPDDGPTICTGCGREVEKVTLINPLCRPDREWTVCGVCLQWLKMKLQGF